MSPHFFALIIGTEILNRRRSDRHFDFISQELLARGYKLSGSFIIEDDPALIVQTLKFLASQPCSVIFSFGGIGSTPDDHTRKSAAIALSDGLLREHPEAREIISRRIQKMNIPNERYPMRMAELPKGAKLLKENPVNNMPGFYLDERYFFVPGFPEMAHPMLRWALDRYFPPRKHKPTRKTLMVQARESAMTDLMEHLPAGVELSSLPKLSDDTPQVSISLSGEDAQRVEEAFGAFKKALEERKISYTETDTP